jgi:hypothetical protein
MFEASDEAMVTEDSSDKLSADDGASQEKLTEEIFSSTNNVQFEKIWKKDNDQR